MNRRDKFTVHFLSTERLKNLEEASVIDTVEREVSKYFNIPREGLRIKTKRPLYTIPVNLCMTLIYNYTRQHLKEISNNFNRTNHATVLSAVETITNIVETKAPTPEKIMLTTFLQDYGYMLPVKHAS